MAREAVIQGEDPAEFESYREGMLADLAPVGTVEALLAERVVGLSWRLLRAERLQNAAFAALDEGEPTPLLEARHEEWKQIKGSEWDQNLAGLFDEDAGLGKVVVADFGGARVLDRLLMYERRIEGSLYRTMGQLRQERQARPATGASAGGVSSENHQTSSGCGCDARFVSRLHQGVSSSGGVGRASASHSTLAATDTSLATATVNRPMAGQEAVAPAELGSFGAEVGAEGVHAPSCDLRAGGGGGCDARFVSRLRQGVSSSGCVGRASASRSTPVATDTSLATATATVNPPTAEVGHHPNIPSFHHPIGVPDTPAEEPSCETNPIPEGRPGGLG